jgi:hypothetical protein
MLILGSRRWDAARSLQYLEAMLAVCVALLPTTVIQTLLLRAKGAPQFTAPLAKLQDECCACTASESLSARDQGSP